MERSWVRVLRPRLPAATGACARVAAPTRCLAAIPIQVLLTLHTGYLLVLQETQKYGVSQILYYLKLFSSLGIQLQLQPHAQRRKVGTHHVPDVRARAIPHPLRHRPSQPSGDKVVHEIEPIL